MGLIIMATISLYCPPMPINKISGKLHRTAAEPMRATITWDDGSTTVIENVIIPITEVDRKGLLRWAVKPCIGKDVNNYVIVELPEEAVVFEIQAMTMVAIKIEAKVTINIPGKGKWTGVVEFPDCPTDILVSPMMAAAVTAEGPITQAA
jgi:hypothetical protein